LCRPHQSGSIAPEIRVENFRLAGFGGVMLCTMRD